MASDSTEFLKKIANLNRDALADAKAKQEQAATLDAKLASMERQLAADIVPGDTAVELKEVERSIRERVMKEGLREFEKAVSEGEQNLSEAVHALILMGESFGEEFAKFRERSPEEQGLITHAEKKLTEAREALTQREDSWNFLFRQEDIAEIEKQIERAKQGITDAKAQAEKQFNARVKNTTYEDSFKMYYTCVQTTREILEKSITAISLRLAEVKTRQSEAFKDKIAAANTIMSLRDELVKTEQELRMASDELSGLTNGTTAYSIQEQKIAGIVNSIEAIRGAHSAALTTFQAKEAAIVQENVVGTTLQKELTNHNSLLARLMAEAEERETILRAWLQAMKAGTEQEITNALHDMGKKIALQTVRDAATLGSISDRMMMESIEAHAGFMRALLESSEAQAEETQVHRGRLNAVMEEFMANYHRDPSETLFIKYEEKTNPAAS
ncbi:MAG: hypothetical protein U1A25_02445 [Candidatus Sungbacteria bacterium]|nr:hypothetical protein [bacterium]MDZ4260501.1 hypothetical protein [Candidatus Sungbacteria bacterium]